MGLTLGVESAGGLLVIVTMLMDTKAGRLGTFVGAGLAAVQLAVARDGGLPCNHAMATRTGALDLLAHSDILTTSLLSVLSGQSKKCGFYGDEITAISLDHGIAFCAENRTDLIRPQIEDYYGTRECIMNERKPSNLESGQLPSKDITPVLKGWDYESGTINVRKVVGTDGSPKLQVRLNLGLLQMEMTGRPDGVRPHGHESLLDYFETQLKEHQNRNGTELGFHLTGEQCHFLREEAMMYYHRYLGLFVLEEYTGVARDTARNLRLMDLCSQFAIDEQDRIVLEQYRPYLTMMNARALASIAFEAKQYDEALKVVERALKSIQAFFARFGQEPQYAHANEVKVLKRFARDIRRKIPVDPLQKLQERLDRAVEEEHYEEAARLRDLIATKKAG
jgi:hypothetical protein